MSTTPRPATPGIDKTPVFGKLLGKMFDWRGRLILTKLAEGCTIKEAAALAGITRQAVLKRKKLNPEFAQAVIEARKTGEKERRYRRWLHHPFRGKRPPTGKGHGGKPAFTYGRR